VPPGVYDVLVNGKPSKGPVRVMYSEDEGRWDEITVGEHQETVKIRVPEGGWVRGYFPDLPEESCVELVKADESPWEGVNWEKIIK
jgi:hypothetical protein